MTSKVSGPKPDEMSSLLPLIGGAIGSIYGGPAGGAIGSQVGGMLGSSNNVGSIDLAQQRLDKQNSLAALQKGQESLKNMPPEMQEKFSPVLEQAMAQAQPQQPQQKPFLPRKEM